MIEHDQFGTSTGSAAYRPFLGAAIVDQRTATFFRHLHRRPATTSVVEWVGEFLSPDPPERALDVHAALEETVHFYQMCTTTYGVMRSALDHLIAWHLDALLCRVTPADLPLQSPIGGQRQATALRTNTATLTSEFDAASILLAGALRSASHIRSGIDGPTWSDPVHGAFCADAEARFGIRPFLFIDSDGAPTDAPGSSGIRRILEAHASLLSLIWTTRLTWEATHDKAVIEKFGLRLMSKLGKDYRYWFDQVPSDGPGVLRHAERVAPFLDIALNPALFPPLDMGARFFFHAPSSWHPAMRARAMALNARQRRLPPPTRDGAGRIDEPAYYETVVGTLIPDAAWHSELLETFAPEREACWSKIEASEEFWWSMSTVDPLLRSMILPWRRTVATFREARRLRRQWPLLLGAVDDRAWLTALARLGLPPVLVRGEDGVVEQILTSTGEEYAFSGAVSLACLGNGDDWDWLSPIKWRAVAESLVSSSPGELRDECRWDFPTTGEIQELLGHFRLSLDQLYALD